MASPVMFDVLFPLRLRPDLPLMPEQFVLVCTEIREPVLELAADCRLIQAVTGPEASK